MKWLHKIHAQPDHIRELIAGACTVVVVVIISMVWFHSFKQNLYTLLNPDQQVQDQFYANASESKSIFASIGQTIKDTFAAISDTFGNIKAGSQTINVQSGNTVNAGKGSAHALPVSGNK